MRNLTQLIENVQEALHAYQNSYGVCVFSRSNIVGACVFLVTHRSRTMQSDWNNRRGSLGHWLMIAARTAEVPAGTTGSKDIGFGSDLLVNRVQQSCIGANAMLHGAGLFEPSWFGSLYCGLAHHTCRGTRRCCQEGTMKSRIPIVRGDTRCLCISRHEIR